MRINSDFCNLTRNLCEKNKERQSDRVCCQICYRVSNWVHAGRAQRSKSASQLQHCMQYEAQWYQMSKISQNISSAKVISRIFPWKFLQIHITSVSGCLYFKFKICQTVAGTSMSRRFHEFLNLVFGGFLRFTYSSCVWSQQLMWDSRNLSK